LNEISITLAISHLF
jgi:T-complex protein 1 subunit eta